ncbi:RES family NAD+ phosphorylase [Pseudogulbenkiania sp. MAI-1]|uniref:RES family NAD+ phosphorylase n=1 Tax=Pseudogulbenkiania sp. MAI-1 TaxID=990370 RepID=UPI0035109393
MPTGKVNLDYGDVWVRKSRSAVLLVLSIIVPEERNILINPKHPEASRIHAKKVRKWLYDSRMA